MSFLKLEAEKKDTIFGAIRNFFGPSYFVTALVVSMTNNPEYLKYTGIFCP